jgi:hypothetical protein
VATKRTFKVVKNLGRSGTLYRAWENWSEGDILVGKYVSEGPLDKYKNPSYIFEVYETFFADKEEGKKLEGQKVTLNHNKAFGSQMEQVSAGDDCQITYDGQKEVKNGPWKGTMAHSPNVQVIEYDEAGEPVQPEDDL